MPPGEAPEVYEGNIGDVVARLQLFPESGQYFRVLARVVQRHDGGQIRDTGPLIQLGHCLHATAASRTLGIETKRIPKCIPETIVKGIL